MIAHSIEQFERASFLGTTQVGITTRRAIEGTPSISELVLAAYLTYPETTLQSSRGGDAVVVLGGFI